MTLEARGVWFRYRPEEAPALRGVDLLLGAGEFVALVGRNGSGKTTLARLLKGLLVPERGRVTVGGWDTREVPASRLAARVGYLFQDPRRQVFCTRVEDEVAFGPRNLGWEESRVQEAVARALRSLELEACARRHPYDLHPALLRRVALASVLAMDPPVLILDEPTAALDAPGRRLLLGLLEDLRSRGRTVLAITHDMEFAAEVFDRVVALEGGRVAADGPPGPVLSRRDLPGLIPPVASRLAAGLGLSPALCRGEELLEALAKERA